MAPAPGARLHLDAAVQGAGDLPGDGEAEAGALAGLLGGEEGLEDVLAGVGGDPAAGVGHREGELVAGAPRPDGQAAAPRPWRRPRWR